MTAACAPGIDHVKGYCGLCIARCGTIATVADGRFIRLDPDPTHPTGAAICAKGRAAPELVYHRDRLTRPLRRARRRRPRSRVAGDRLGHGARSDRRCDAAHRRAIWTGSRCLQPVVSLDNRRRGFRLIRSQADECLRHSEPCLATRLVRLGPRLRHALCLRRR